MKSTNVEVRSSLVVTVVVLCLTAGAVLLALFLGRGVPQRAARQLRDVTADEARAAGIKLPVGATHVYYQGCKIPGSAAVYARFELDPSGLVDYQTKLARRPGVKMGEGLMVPPSWPRLGGELAPPDWWIDAKQQSRSMVALVDHSSSLARASGKLWVLDGPQKRIYHWSWNTSRQK